MSKDRPNLKSINLWELITHQEHCKDTLLSDRIKIGELLSELGRTGRYGMQELQLFVIDRDHAFLPEGWLIRVFAVGGYERPDDDKDDINIMIPSKTGIKPYILKPSQNWMVEYAI